MSKVAYEQLRAECAHFWPPGYPLVPKYDARELIEFRCEKAIATDSLDHIEPRGTAKDNTHWVPFIARCEAIFGFRDLRYLDLGCAGGGLVFDFLARRHFAIGLEGSDFSLLRRRAEWATIPHHLFTCDITHPFRVLERATGETLHFDVIGIWDALEHLPEERLPTFFSNVAAHLSPQGVFCGTVSTREASASTGDRNHHATVKPKCWWETVFANHKLELIEPSPFELNDFPRGNGILFPADFSLRPDDGFHFVARKSAAA
jgi:2-polyprenyl-3-methyl-5-hydroxy-6-metoxy-1,4-benzoquinol methylase